MSNEGVKLHCAISEDHKRCPSSMWLEEYLCLLYFRNFKLREVAFIKFPLLPQRVCLTSFRLSKVEVNVAHPQLWSWLS